MKIRGKEIDLKGFVEVVVIPRGEEEFVFKARPVTSTDFEVFDKLCPQPKAPLVTKPGMESYEDTSDGGYLHQRTNWFLLRQQFIFFISLSATEGLEFNNVKLEEPTSWEKMLPEFEEAGFSVSEINAIVDCIIRANALDNNKIEKATKSFLALQAQKEQEANT